MSPIARPSLWTGQINCYDTQGNVIECAGSGQDAEFQAGLAWPSPRFSVKGEIVKDHLTGLYWTRKSNFADFPLSWQESLDFIADMNRQNLLGFNDWRLPNRRELRSLLSFHNHRPALPTDHPFTDVFLGWYWTSSTAAISPDHAWYVHLEGGRMFYGGKDQSYLSWPVRGRGNGALPQTGQRQCYNSNGEQIDCEGSGQDGEILSGRVWPQPRFKSAEDIVEDCLTGIRWAKQAAMSNRPLSWPDALFYIEALNQKNPARQWRLPNINELESLVDCSQSSPALAGSSFFDNIKDVYWSSTTSVFEPDWAMALYINKGAVGVGQKYLPEFFIWPVLV